MIHRDSIEIELDLWELELDERMRRILSRKKQDAKLHGVEPPSTVLPEKFAHGFDNAPFERMISSYT